jgi:hypothetical protein
MKRATTVVVATAVAVGVAVVGQAAEVTVYGADGGGGRNHTVYVGVGGGFAQLSTSGNSRKVSGIDFTFSADANDMGQMGYIGGWITDHVGVEIGARNYGNVKVPFGFHDPHDNTSGTGESEVTIAGLNIALMLGFDIGRAVQIVGRAGMLTWKEKYDSRFDIPGKPAINAEMETSGTGPVLGLGITYRFTPGWQLEGRYEFATLDEDTISLATLGLSYDLIGLLR